MADLNANRRVLASGAVLIGDTVPGSVTLAITAGRRVSAVSTASIVIAAGCDAGGECVSARLSPYRDETV
jgi:hypothetical protein